MSIGNHLEKILVGGGILAFVAILGGMCWYEYNPKSRRTLNPAGKTIEYALPQDFSRMVNVSSAGSEGDIMMTYETKDGRFITKEYNRQGLFQTDIHWKMPDTREE